MTHSRDTESYVQLCPTIFNNEDSPTLLREDNSLLFRDSNVAGVDVKHAIGRQINLINSEADPQCDPFFICDIGDIVKKFQRWNRNLPQVEPFYAMKCNPDPVVVRLLSSLGVNFDCASKAEIRQILDLGVHPSRIVYANPCKQQSHIRYAASEGVSMMTFDNEMELHKVKRLYPSAKLIIRILVDDSKSLCKFGIKYGICPTRAKQLLQVAKELDLDVCGVSFHVGSGCFDASAFYQAVANARSVFNDAEDVGFKFSLLDIGGGFPGVDGEDITFEEVCDQLTSAFDRFFPPESNVRIIAEPGRYFVASAFTSVTNITSIRAVEDAGEEGYMYYVNDGVYGSFNCIMFDHQFPKASPFEEENKSRQLFRSSIWGPTCDSMDCITMDAKLPKMEMGEWLYFRDMGAYTIAAASKFNGYSVPKVIFACNTDLWESIRLLKPAVHKEGAPDILMECPAKRCIPRDPSQTAADDQAFYWCNNMSVKVEQLLHAN